PPPVLGVRGGAGRGGGRGGGRRRARGEGRGLPRLRNPCGGRAAQRQGGKEESPQDPPHDPATAGSRTMTLVPWPIVEWISMLPWCRSTTRRARARPMPVPSRLVV